MALKASNDLLDALRSAAVSTITFFEPLRTGREFSSSSSEFFRDGFDTRRLDLLPPSSCFLASASSSESSDCSLSSYERFGRRPLGFSIFLNFAGCSSSLSDPSLSSSSMIITKGNLSRYVKYLSMKKLMKFIN